MEKLTPAMEDYLKKIYCMSGYDIESVVHVNDLALRMGVSKACTSRATNILSEKGLIRKRKYQGFSLTPQGKKQAAVLSKRYSVLRRFFSEILRVDPLIAAKDACKFEHSISAESYRSIREYLRNAE